MESFIHKEKYWSIYIKLQLMLKSPIYSYFHLQYNCTDVVCMQIILIRFNLVLVYLLADSTA
jgi:hypothetical protein